MNSIRFIKRAIFVAALFIPVIYISGSSADNISAACSNNASYSTGGAINSPTSVLTPTADNQIFKDACGFLLAVMKSQVATPTSSTQAIASDYGLSLAGNPVSSVPVLHSNPEATRKLYLDFDGYTFPSVSNDSAWFGYFGGLAQPGASIAGLDLDGNPNSFSQLEQAYITETWVGVAEDFAPFDIDVTTENPGTAGLTRANTNDESFGQTAVISSAASWSAQCGCGGVSYVAAINVIPSAIPGTRSLNPYGVNFNFNKFSVNSSYYVTAKDLAGIISHESGHAVGLGHDGSSSTGYYPGHSNGIWAPIMGTSYGVSVSQWSKNEYSGGTLTSSQGYVSDSGYGWYWPNNNNKDDFDIITLNNIPLRSDDYGDNKDDAYVLNRASMSMPGIVGPNDDIDYFKFTLNANQVVSATANPIAKSPNLDILMKLYNSNGELITAYDPPIVRGNDTYPTGMNASFSRRALTAGTYYLSIEGTGWGNPLNTGYSNYASVGQYTFDFTIHLLSQTTLRISNTTLINEVGTEVTMATTGGSGTGDVTFETTNDACSITDDKITAEDGQICPVRAFKESDGNYGDATSATVNFTFREAQATLSITNQTTTGAVGTPITLTTSGGSGTGLVTYSLSTANPLCSFRRDTVNATSGTTCSVIATKAASGIYSSKSSSTVVFTFKGPQNALVIANSTLSNAVGTEVTLSTTGGSGTGSVSYTVTGTNCSIASNKLSASDAATCVVTATKAADNTFASKDSSAVTFTFLAAQADLSITNQTTTNAINTSVVLTSSGGSGGGALTYSLSTANALCIISNDRIISAQPTSCSVIVTRAASGLYASKTSSAVTFYFKGPQATLRIANTTLVNNVGTEVTLSIIGGSGSGSVTYTATGTNCSVTSDKLSASDGANCVVTATKASDNTYAQAVSATKTFTFLAAQSTLSVSNQTTTGTVGTPITLTSSGGSGTGRVSYSLSTANSLCRISRESLSATAGTTCSVIATKAAQGLYSSKTSSAVTFTFKGPQATLVVSNATTTNSVGTEVTLTSSGGSGTGSVSFAVTGTDCSISSGKLSASGPATCSVIATKASDNTYSEISSAAKIFTFLADQSTLSISNQTTTNAVNTIVTLTTSGGSGTGAVTYALTTANALCTLSGATLTAAQPTQCAVTATKAAQGLYNAKSSSSVTFNFKGAQATFRITNSIRTASVGITQTISTSGGSGSGTVSYSATGTNCSITGDQLSASGPAICVVTATKAGDSTYNEISTSTNFTFIASQSTLSISNATTTNPIGTSVTLTTSGGSGTGYVSFALSTPNAACSLRRNVLTATSGTTCSVVATKAASGLYSAKSSTAVTFTFANG